ncbi:hypothetical protein GW17_00014770, partial [Ensete ventricosum]
IQSYPPPKREKPQRRRNPNPRNLSRAPHRPFRRPTSSPEISRPYFLSSSFSFTIFSSFFFLFSFSTFFVFFFFGVGCRKDRRFPRNGFFFRDISCWVLICSGLTPVSCSGIRVSSGSHLSSRSPTVIAPAESIPRLVLSPACLSLGKINLLELALGFWFCCACVLGIRVCGCCDSRFVIP